ncbi:MAG: hypothetical protein ACYTG5_11025 [Planctomycetota bacterium]
MRPPSGADTCIEDKNLILRSLLCLSLLLTCLPAQRTIVVDRRGGGDFTTIDAAVADADPGDTVIVRAGAYPDIRLEKGINLLGDPEANLRTLVVASIPADQAATVSGFEIGEDFGPNNTVIATSGCLGPVTFANLRANAVAPNIGQVTPTLRVIISEQVSIKDCFFAGRSAAEVQNSTVIFSGCELIGGDAIPLGQVAIGSAPALSALNSEVISSDTSYRGGKELRVGGALIFPPRPAMEFDGGSLRLCGGSLTAGSSVTPLVAGNVSAVYPNGSNFCSRTPDASDCREELIPCLSADRAQPGGPVSITLTAAAGSSACILLGLTGPRMTTIWGDLWIDQGTMRGLFGAIVPVGGQVQIEIPNVPFDIPLGQLYTAQAAVFDGLTIGLSPPVPFVVH